MKLLIENWRKYLLDEGGRTVTGPGGLVEYDTYIVLYRSGPHIRVFYSNAKGHNNSGGDLPSIGYPGGVPKGEVRATKVVSQCLGAYQVKWSEAEDQWGPLLYDVVMEAAGDFGLMADRSSLSAEAFNVWRFYMRSRDDVQKKQLDDKANTLTKDTEEDNCGTTTAREFDDAFDGYGDMVQQALIDSPVMKVYTKGPTTIQKLEAAERLIKR